MKKHRTLLLTAAIVAAAAALVITPLTFSYLIDTDRADNIITIGKVDLTVDEGQFEDSQIIPAGGTLPKAPKIINTGVNDEYVFLEIAVPKREVTLLYEQDTTVEGVLHKNGTPVSGKQRVEIFKVLADGTGSALIQDNDPQFVFSYHKGDSTHEGWVYLSDYTTTSGETYNYYYFGYNKRRVAGNDEKKATMTLFDQIRLKSFIENELSEPDVQVNVRAFGIQADELGLEALEEHDDSCLTDAQVKSVFAILKEKQVI